MSMCIHVHRKKKKENSIMKPTFDFAQLVSKIFFLLSMPIFCAVAAAAFILMQCLSGILFIFLTFIDFNKFPSLIHILLIMSQNYSLIASIITYSFLFFSKPFFSTSSFIHLNIWEGDKIHLNFHFDFLSFSGPFTIFFFGFSPFPLFFFSVYILKRFSICFCIFLKFYYNFKFFPSSSIFIFLYSCLTVSPAEG